MTVTPRRRTMAIAAVTGAITITGIGAGITHALSGGGADDPLPALDAGRAPSTTVDHITVATAASTSTTVAPPAPHRRRRS